MDFKLWLESNNKKLLLLIHPDCIAENGPDKAKNYQSLLKQHVSKFDHVITHAFYSGEDWIKHSIWEDDWKVAFYELYNTIKSISDHFLYNSKDIYGCSYSSQLPDYLIDNPNTEIYMAGGYEDNCLWISYKLLFEQLDWMLRENSVSVFYYKPLIFSHPRTYQSQKFQDYEKTWGDFHPDKVKYKN